MSEHINAWQCIGCGRIEAPQNCIGICEDRKVEFVYAFEHEDALARLELASSQVTALTALVRRLASTTPRDDAWERSYRALQEQARALLAHSEAHAPPAAGASVPGARSAEPVSLPPPPGGPVLRSDRGTQ